MTDERAIEELLAKQQIMDAMARYARGIDRRDEELVRSAYHEDSFDDHGWGLSAGGWDIAALVRRDGNGFPDDWKYTQHFLGQHFIEVDGDTASSEVYFRSTTRVADEEGVDWDMTTDGRYVDQWVRRDGVFRIINRTVVYDAWRTDVVSTPWPGPDHDVAKMAVGGAPIDVGATTLGTAGPDDPSYALLARRASATA